MEETTRNKKRAKPNIFLRLLAFLLTAALILGAVALVVFRDRVNLGALKHWLTYRQLETSLSGQTEPFALAGGDRLSVACMQDGILTASTTGARYYSFSGELFWEAVQPLEHPVLSVRGNSGVVYDAGGQSLFLLRKAEQAFSLSLDGGGEVLSARLNEKGWLAVTAQQDGYKGSVTVYNDKGGEVIRVSLSSTFVVDAAISPDCRTVAVVTMGQKNDRFDSEVVFYPVDSDTPSGRISLGDCMVLDLDYEQDRLWALCEDRLCILTPSDGQTAQYPFGRGYLKSCHLEGDGFALVVLSDYRAGSAAQALSIAGDGSVNGQLDLKGVNLQGSSCAAGRCALLTGSELTVYDPWLSPLSGVDSTQSARYVSLSPTGAVLLATGQSVWMQVPG